ncbi:MAG: hypothetical protein WBK97_02955 [Bacteroidales bacterium]|jgi:hypothetical protein
MIFTDYIKRSAWGALLLSLFILLAFRVIFLFVNQPENNTVVLLLTVIPVLATGIILTLFCDTYGLLPDRTRWILVTYAWLVAVSPCSYDKWQAVVAGVFVTGALYRLAAGSHEQLGRSHSFIGAFYITCAGLLFRPAFLLYMPLIIGLILMSEVTLKNFLAFLGGIVVPFILLAAGFWFAGYDIGLYMERTLKELTLRNVTFGLQTFSLTQWVSLMVFVLLLLLSVIVRGIRRDSSGSLNKTRFYHAMFWFLLFTAAGLFIWPGHAQGFTVLFLIPASYFITSLFSETRLFGRKVWLALFILASVVYFVTNLGVLPSGF